MNLAPPLRQFSVLFRHFFSRLSYNELLKFENQQRESRVVLLVILAVAGMLVANAAYEPFLLFAIFDMSLSDLWRYEAMLVTFSMAIAGVLAVASWDKLFLDRLDQVNLRPLPVSARKLFAAKSLGLLAFVIAVTAVGNFFPVLIAAAYPADLLGSLSAGPAHFAAALLGSLFVFLAVALLQELVMILLPPGLGKRVAVLAQALLLFVFLSPLVWFPLVHRSLPALKAGGSAFFRHYPPMWFTGIFHRLIGLRDPVLDAAGRLGIFAIIVLLLLYLLVSPASLRRFIRGTAAAPAARRRRASFPAGRRLLASVFLRHPVQRAVFSFFMQTLRRSREHKLKLTLFLALPVSYLLSQFVFIYFKKGLSGRALDSLLISMPLALHFFLVIGMRLTIAYPHTLSASFIFRSSESLPLRHYMNGLKKALFCSAVILPPLVSLPLQIHFWGWRPAFLHALYSLAVAILLVEILFFNSRKVPFATEHVPGKFKLRFYWPVMVLGFLLYDQVLTGLGKSLRHSPSGYPVFFLLVALICALLRVNQRRRLAGERLVFEEEPEPAMMTLGFD